VYGLKVIALNSTFQVWLQKLDKIAYQMIYENKSIEKALLVSEEIFANKILVC
jgi:hypothetical protein